jgi:PAS domain S-box-containing protein
MPNSVSRAALEVLLDRVSQGVATLSPEATVVYTNQRFASLVGRTRAQLVGMALSELVATADREAVSDAVSNGRDTASQCRVTMLRANGNGPFQALLTIAPLGHGQASCLVTDLSPKE